MRLDSRSVVYRYRVFLFVCDG
uniref:Uncharacterized protein n=1 Tax=Arundo donax TaxID=35708 RepID=A0A0A9CB83_ARUDO